MDGWNGGEWLKEDKIQELEISGPQDRTRLWRLLEEVRAHLELSISDDDDSGVDSDHGGHDNIVYEKFKLLIWLLLLNMIKQKFHDFRLSCKLNCVKNRVIINTEH